MLKTTIFNVLNNVLDGNIESVDLYYDYDKIRKLQITTKSKIMEADFVNKTSHIISAYDIGSTYDKDGRRLNIHY